MPPALPDGEATEERVKVIKTYQQTGHDETGTLSLG